MKIYLILYSLLFLFSINIIAQNEKEHIIKTNINSIIVYLSGAEINRAAEVDLIEGNNLLIFKSLSPELDSKSIRVSANKDISILRISSKKNFLTKPKELPRIINLKDSLEIILNSNKDFFDEIDALKIEKEMLLANKSIGGNNNGVSINELKQNAEFFRQRIMDINKRITLLERKSVKNLALTERMKQELTELNSKSEYTENDINVLINSSLKEKVRIELKYLVNKAGWVPAYDIKAFDLAKPIELVYKA
ncbi:MAG: DUF4140 domain-containing protein [Bacteroidales bacterium]|nr:DUF4140 domain-containing protein [Bacteroidales bacterium]MBN2757851.1 DUF4140 domain-containing protein [Bacteroidales bacterium]